MNDLEFRTMGHLFYTTLNFVQHFFKAIGIFKHELQSGNAQFRSKLVIFCPTWPWKLTNDLKKNVGHLFYTRSSFVHHFKSIGEVKLELQYGNAQFGSKLAIFLSRVTLKFDGWPWKTIGHLFYTILSFVQHLKAIGIFKLQLQSGNAQFRSKLAIFYPVWPWKLTDDLEKQ